MRFLHSTKDKIYGIMSEVKNTSAICYNDGKEVLAFQLSVAEYYSAIAVQRIANSISQSLSVISDFFFRLLLYGIRLVF